MICFLCGLQRTKAECEICGYFAFAQYDSVAVWIFLLWLRLATRWVAFLQKAQNDKGLFVILTSLLSY